MDIKHQSKDLANLLLSLNDKNKQELGEQEKQLLLIAEITRVLKDIDNIIDIKIRQVFLRGVSVEVLSSYAYIINQKYDRIIALLTDSETDQILKSNLQAEKTNFNNYFQELLLCNRKLFPKKLD